MRGKRGAIGNRCLRIDGSGPGGTIAAAQVIGANDEILIGVEGLSGTNKAVPPTRVAVFCPKIAHSLDSGIEPGGVLATGQSVKKKDGVIPPLVEMAVGFVAQRGFPTGIHPTSIKEDWRPLR